MRASVFLLLLSFARATPLSPREASLSSDLAHRVHQMSAALAETPAGRLLLAEASGIRRLETKEGGAAVVYLRREPPALAFDPKLLGALGPWEAELSFSRELARAGMGLPLELHEGRMAAVQKELDFALDLCAAQPRFSRVLRRAFDRVENKLRSAGLDALPEPPIDEVERVAYFQNLFSHDPDRFYWAVEKQGRADPQALSLRELEDFLERHSESLETAAAKAGSPYIRVGGRRYRAPLVLAAKRLLKSGGLERIHEAMGPFDSVGAAALKAKLNAWLRETAGQP